MDAEHIDDLITDPDCDYEALVMWGSVYFVGDLAVGIWFGAVLVIAILLWRDREDSLGE